MRPPHLKNRSALLDCIRAVAIIMVIGFHVALEYPRADLDTVALFLRRYGLLGVAIFFPLSGYLISSFLLTRDYPGFLKTFFLRRFFRIVPLYFVAVTVFALAMIVTRTDLHLLDRMWVPYSFLTAWIIFFQGEATVPYTITWSLSVEEFAYIVFGLVTWFSRRSMPAFLIAMSILPILLRWYLYWESANGNHTPAIHYFPLARIDAIATGGVLAWLMVRKTPLKYLLLGFGGLTLLSWVLVQQTPVLNRTFLYSLTTFGTCFCIALFDGGRWRMYSNAVTEVIANIGFYSYFTYLFHYFNVYALFAVVHKLFATPPSFWIMTLAALVLTHVQAMISYKIFEGPMMRFGRKLEGRKETGGKKAAGMVPVPMATGADVSKPPET